MRASPGWMRGLCRRWGALPDADVADRLALHVKPGTVHLGKVREGLVTQVAPASNPAGENATPGGFEASPNRAIAWTRPSESSAASHHSLSVRRPETSGQASCT
jgi:hypothetical protein